MTAYKILVLTGHEKDLDIKLWAEAGQADAASAKAAVSAHVKKNGSKEGVFIAVPTRSWTPVTVKTEQKVQLRFS